MSAIDFILNLAGLLLWLNWRAVPFDPLAGSKPLTLVGTLRPAEPARLRGWSLWGGLVLLLVLRAALYWSVGSPAEWTPKLNLGSVVLAFRGDHFNTALLFSLLSFARVLLIFYFWVLILVLLNQDIALSDPIQKLLRLHLGRFGRWQWWTQLLVVLLVVVGGWLALYPLLVSLGVIGRVHSQAHLLGQGLLLATGLVLSLKHLCLAFLLVHLVSSYVYLGSSPVWDFVSATVRNLLRPLARLPLRSARIDFGPVLALVLLTLLFYEPMPRVVRYLLNKHNLSLWPQ